MSSLRRSGKQRAAVPTAGLERGLGVAPRRCRGYLQRPLGPAYRCVHPYGELPAESRRPGDVRWSAATGSVLIAATAQREC
jgi:hypothetical protein